MKPSILFDPYKAFTSELIGPIQEDFLDTYWSSLPEIELQSRWFEGDFGTHFISTDGISIEILDFGVWNHCAGPDFGHCALRIGEEIVKGSIELDTCLQDWETHGHRDNPAYEDVRLHLHVWANSPQEEFFVRTFSNRMIPQVRLEPRHLLPLNWKGITSEVRLGRCADKLKQMREGEIQDLLKSAAYHRFKEKEHLWLHRCEILGKEQTAYQTLAYALGYSRNSSAFTILAQRLSLRELKSFTPSHMEAVMFGVAGFLEKAHYDSASRATQQYLKLLWSEWWQVRQVYERWLETDQQVRWDGTGTRPMNHPQRRLAALLMLVQKWRSTVKCLFPSSPEHLSNASVTQFLESISHPFWDHHFTLHSASQTHAMSLIGATRAHEIYLNVILPAYAALKPELWGHYEQLLAPDINQQVRRAALRLFGEAHRNSPWLKRAIFQQGLLKIYRDFCLKDYSACEQCQMPGMLPSGASQRR